MLEVHTHIYTSGPRAGRPGAKFAHSHDGGNIPHQHENAGPACYAIDKDDWLRLTGIQMSGRKKFTSRPIGEQLPIEELEPWQKQFIVHGPIGTGIVERLILEFKMQPRVKI